MTATALAAAASVALGVDADRTAIREWLVTQDIADVMDAAAEWVADHIRDRNRQLARVAERETERAARPADCPQSRPAAPSPEALRRAAESAARSARLESLRIKVNGHISDHMNTLSIEWSPRLLSTSIHMPDGTRTTWGKASIAQHEARARMFTDQAAAGVEGAALHRRAIETLRAAGATTLDGLTRNQEVAAA